MARNPDFKKLVFNDVEFSWPRLDQPYRFDSRKKETVPCPATAQNAGYSLAWEISPERAERFAAEMQAHYEECRARNSSLPEFSRVFGMNAKDGKVMVTARKNAVNQQGEENDPPIVVDEYHSELQDPAIWTGSEGSVSVLAYPSTNPQDGSGGISLLLRNVLVTKALYGGLGLEDDFGEPKQRSAADLDAGLPSGVRGSAGYDERNPPPMADMEVDMPF